MFRKSILGFHARKGDAISAFHTHIASAHVCDLNCSVLSEANDVS